MGGRESTYIASLGTEAYATILGARVRYFQAGEGPSAVLLHGLGDAAITWHDNVGPLAQRFTTVVPDLPGRGMTQTKRRGSSPVLEKPCGSFGSTKTTPPPPGLWGACW